MPSFEYDLRYLQAGLEIIDSYLLSDQIYWSIGINAQRGEPSYPSFTLGGLLLANKRIHARSLTLDQERILQPIDQGFNAIRMKWRVAWEKKAANEFRARLNLWRDFLEEYRQNPEGNADRYAYEVSRRVMLTLLAQETSGIQPAEEELLRGLDKLVEASLKPGDFIWETEIASGFPQEKFPYLYGRLRISWTG